MKSSLPRLKLLQPFHALHRTDFAQKERSGSLHKTLEHSPRPVRRVLPQDHPRSTSSRVWETTSTSPSESSSSKSAKVDRSTVFSQICRRRTASSGTSSSDPGVVDYRCFGLMLHEACPFANTDVAETFLKVEGHKRQFIVPLGLLTQQKIQPPLQAQFPIPSSSCCYMYQPRLRTPTRSSENTRKAAKLVQVFMVGRCIRDGGQDAAYIPGWPGLRLEGSMVPELSMLLYSSGSSCICSCN